MKCKKIEKKILDFIEGNVNVKEKEEIEKHLQECINCSDLYNDFLFILKNSKKIKVPQINENLWKTTFNLIIKKEEKIISLLKPLYITVSLLIFFFSIVFYTKIYLPRSKKLLHVSQIPVRIELINHELPFSEDEMIKYVDFMKEEEVEKVLDFIFAGL